MPERINGCTVKCWTCGRSAAGAWGTVGHDWNAMNDGAKVTSELLDDLERVL
jgi:hypothetical protein